MTNVVLVVRKLASLEEHLRRARERRPEDLAAFRTDALLQDAVALSALVVVQGRDPFVTLERHGLLDAALTARLAAAAQLRNRIAHGYLSLDVDRLWSELPDGIAAFSSFAAPVAAFLAKDGAA